MWSFQRIDPFPFFSGFRFVTTVGGGGKTTFGEYLASRAVQEGRRAVITTTTKIRAEEPYVLFDRLAGHYKQQGPVRVGKSVADGKLTSLSFDEVRVLGEMFDLVVIEGDGSRGKPLKYPSATEPVIPPFSDHTVVVGGLDGLGSRVAEQVFRWEIFRDETGVGGDAQLDLDSWELLFGTRAMMKGVQADRGTILLNKYDACRDRQSARLLAKNLLRVTKVTRVLISSLRFRIFYSVSNG